LYRRSEERGGRKMGARKEGKWRGEEEGKKGSIRNPR